MSWSVEGYRLLVRFLILEGSFFFGGGKGGGWGVSFFLEGGLLYKNFGGSLINGSFLRVFFFLIWTVGILYYFPKIYFFVGT